MSIIATLLFLTAEIAPFAAANIAVGHNKQEFAALCTFIKLARSTVSIPEVGDSGDAAYLKIQMFNMLVAQDDWKKRFYTGEESPKYHKNVPPNAPKPNNWEQRWSAWQVALEQIENTQGDDDLKNSPFSKLTKEQKTWVRPQLNQIAEQAAALKELAQEQAETRTALDPAMVTKKIQEAVYGVSGKEESALTVNDIWGGTMDGVDRQTACEVSNAENIAKSILGIVACICMDKQVTALAGACHNTHTNTEQWPTANGSPTAQHIRDTIAACQPGETTTLTAAAVGTTLSGLVNLITVSGDDGYLGAFKSGQCDRANTNGLCVKLTNYKTAQAAALANIPWYQHMLTLRKQLEQREATIKRAQLSKQLMESELEKALQLGEHALTYQLPKSNNAQEQDTGHANQGKAQQQRKECDTIKKATECKEKQPKCEWKNKDANEGPHCQLNERAISEQAAQAGKGDGGTGTEATAG
uniref:Variant surface glycoprotein 1152 n=1 Tax=Trypanosoma brucei TaxID=5691 RepID=M4SXS1_9TRYP|nr:variant surface glycoprotein 1152 [Trypanosoma brucei]